MERGDKVLLLLLLFHKGTTLEAVPAFCVEGKTLRKHIAVLQQKTNSRVNCRPVTIIMLLIYRAQLYEHDLNIFSHNSVYLEKRYCPAEAGKSSLVS